MALPSNAWRRVHQYAKIAQESNLAPRRRSPPNGASEQSGVLRLLSGNESHSAENCIQQDPYPRQVRFFVFEVNGRPPVRWCNAAWLNV